MMKINFKDRKIFVPFTITLIAIVIAGVAYVYSTRGDNATYVDHYAIGIGLSEKHFYSEAVVEFGKAIDQDSSRIESYIQIADIYTSKNRFEDALNILKTGLEQYPDDHQLNLKLAEIYDNNLYDLTTAIPFYEKANISDIELASKYMRVNDLVKATATLEKVSAGSTDYTKAVLLKSYVNATDINAFKKIIDLEVSTEDIELQQKLDSLRRAVEGLSEGNELSAYSQIGYYVLEDGYYDISEAVFKHIAKNLDDYWASHFYLGVIYIQKGDLENAEKELLSAQDKNPTSADIHRYLARIYDIQKDQNKTLDSYAKAVSLDENNENLLAEYVQVLRKYGIYTKAELIYKTLATFTTSNNWIDYRLDLARLYINDIKDYNKAQEVLEVLITEWSGYEGSSVQIKSNIADLYGWSYYLTGDIVNANVKLSEAYDFYNYSAPVHYHLGVLLKSNKQYDQARNYLERSIDLDMSGEVTKDANRELEGI